MKEYCYTIIQLSDYETQIVACFGAPVNNLTIKEVVENMKKEWHNDIEPDSLYLVNISGTNPCYSKKFYFECDNSGDVCYLLERTRKEVIYNKK